MKLTKSSALGVFACIHLAPSGHQLTEGAEIAKELDVPSDSLLKILQTLVRARVLRSTRGRGGGFSLNRPPRETTVLSIVEAIEGPLEGTVLGLDNFGGSQEAKKTMELKLQEASRFARDLLAQTTIADLLQGTNLPV